MPTARSHTFEPGDRARWNVDRDTVHQLHGATGTVTELFQRDTHRDRDGIAITMDEQVGDYLQYRPFRGVARRLAHIRE